MLLWSFFLLAMLTITSLIIYELYKNSKGEGVPAPCAWRRSSLDRRRDGVCEAERWGLHGADEESEFGGRGGPDRWNISNKQRGEQTYVRAAQQREAGGDHPGVQPGDPAHRPRLRERTPAGPGHQPSRPASDRLFRAL